MVDVAADPAAVPAGERKVGLSLSARCWALLEGGRNPYVNLVTIYIFAPYFAASVVGDPVKGQALIAQIAVAYGLFAAVTAPFIGAAVDRFGPRKPWLALATALNVPLIACLWFAKPHGAGLSVAVVSTILATCGVLVAWSQLLQNAMLTYAATPAERPAASGLGLALGNLISVAMLVAVLWAFALPGKIALPGVPSAPLFGLNPALNEPDRVVAPITAVFYGLLALPLFFFTRDAPRRNNAVGTSTSTQDLIAALKGLRQKRDLGKYLIAQMLFTDGLTAILFFTGVYAGGVMKWQVLQLLSFALVLSIPAVFGGFLSGWMDRWIGTKRTLLIQLAACVVTQILLLGVAPERIFYVIPWAAAEHAPLWGGPVFRTVPELVYLGIGMVSAIAVTGAYASSRMMLVRLAPVKRIGVYFGLFSLSSTVTTWLGSLLVGLATAVFGTQQAGMVPIMFLLGTGGAILWFVTVPPAPPED